MPEVTSCQASSGLKFLLRVFVFSEQHESSSRQDEDPESLRQREEVGSDLRPGGFVFAV